MKKMVYGLAKNMPLDKEDILYVSRYIKDGIKLGTIKEYNANLFDIKTLNIMVNLDCLNCHKIHSTLCCDGVCYPPCDEDADLIFRNYKKILKSQCSHDLYLSKLKHIEKYGLFVYLYDYHDMYGTMEQYENKTFRMHDGRCVFSVPVNKEKPDGAYKCAIHSYALQKDIKVFDLKPKTCQLFPIDIIRINDKFDFVFGCCEETMFNRYHDTVDCCVAFEKAKGVYKKTGAFNPKDYKPIYIEERELLTGLYGVGVYNFIRNARYLKW